MSGKVATVRILGGVQAVAADGSLIDLPSVSQRRLVAILALHAPRHLRSEWLADALDISPGALRTSVSRVRTTVGGDIIESASIGYALHSDVDASEFCRAAAVAASSDDRIDALQRALALWNGPPLEEFVGEEWADGEIARLTEIHAGTVDDLALTLIEARRAADAVALLERQIALYPYRDRSRGLLIRALASEGRQADALRAFQQYRSLLVEEFGTDPSPEVVRIERRVATGWDGIESEPKVDTARDTDDRTAAVDIPLSSELTHHGSFVGRAEELNSLGKELSLVTASGLRAVMLGGEAGIGKTALLARFANELLSNGTATVAYGRCDETSASLQPFRRVLAGCVEHAPLSILNEHVAKCGGELLRMCPALATRVATTPAPTGSDDATERYLVFDAAADLLTRIAAARPLVLMLDDLQWAEPSALLLLRHLAHGLAGAPVLLVLTSRELGDHASEALRLAFADLERADARRLSLAGLDGGELDTLATTTGVHGSGSESVGAALRAQTAGNPLFASQLIRHWNEAGFDRDAVPESLRDVVWSRVTALGDRARDVLTVASVLGLEFDEDVLCDMVELPELDVVDALDAAARGGLLIDAGTVRRSLRFVHALVANALYADLGSSRRARLHGRAAQALEKSVDELPPGVVVQIARHWGLAGRAVDAQRWSTRAGDYSLENLAPAEAASHYRAALDIALALDRPLPEQADLLVRLGDAQHRAGDIQALDTLEQGARLAQRCGAREALIRAAFAGDRGFMRIDAGAPEYLATVEAALAAADRTDVATYARLRALLARSLIYTPDAAGRLAAAHEAIDLATEQGDPVVLAQVAPAALYALMGAGHRELRGRVAAQATRASESTGDPGLVFSAHLSAYNLAVESADHVVAARSLARMRALAKAVAEPRLRWTVGLYDTFDATMAGRLEDAEAIATANLDLGLQIGVPDAFTFFAGQLFVIASDAGRADELLPVVEQAMHDNPGMLPFKLAYGIICAGVPGRDDDARDILREGVATRFGELAVDNVWMTSIIGYAVLAIELGDVEAAAYLRPIIEPFAADVAFNGVTSQGPVATYLGRLSSLLGEYDIAEEYLRAALDTATAFGWRYHRATAMFSLAQTRYRRDGALDRESEAWLEDASALCRAGSYKHWAAQVDALVELNAR